MLKRSLFLLVASVLALQTSAAVAQQKVGIFNFGKVLQSMPDLAKARQKLEAEIEPLNKEINDLQAELVKLKKDTEKNQAILDVAEYQSRQDTFQRKQRELGFLLEDRKKKEKRRSDEAIAAAQRKIQAEIIKLSQEEGYDLVLSSGVFYFDPKIDITDKILKRMSEK